MNKRDARGWRIPRKGTKSYEIYHLMVAGFTRKEIYQFYPESSTKVLICSIKRWSQSNKRANKYYNKNSERLKLAMKSQRTKKSPTEYSAYVKKLVRVLGVTYTEAVEIEEKYK